MKSQIPLGADNSMGDLRIRDALPFWLSGGVGILALILLAYFMMPEPVIEYSRP